MVETHVNKAVCMFNDNKDWKKKLPIIVIIITLSSRIQIPYVQSSGCFYPIYSHLNTAILLHS